MSEYLINNNNNNNDTCQDRSFRAISVSHNQKIPVAITQTIWPQSKNLNFDRIGVVLSKIKHWLEPNGRLGFVIPM